MGGKQAWTAKPTSRSVGKSPSPHSNIYNPRGLTVRVILDAIRSSFGTDKSTILDPTRLAFEMQRAAKAYIPTAEILLNNWFQWDEDHPAIPGFRFRSLLDADEMAIKPYDDSVAADIRNHPILLLLSPVHAAAVSRWLYAKEHGVTDRARGDARGYLQTAFPPRAGAPVRFKGDLSRLRQTFDDLVEYGTGLRTCIRRVSTPELLTTYFDDCTLLADAAGVDPTRLIGKSARDIPTGKQLAIRVFERRVGWSRTQIKKKLFSASPRHIRSQ